jgi:hypothetical protein
MHRSIPLARQALLALAFVPAASCQDQAPVRAAGAESHGVHASAIRTSALSAEVNKDLAALRRLTARFHQFDAAAKAGWGTRITECFSNAEAGGMGFHYGNTAYIDGAVDVLEPELLLYEPQKNGKLRFVAVEYIVPFTAWTAAEPPKLFGQSFHRNEAFGLWVLHVWHERENPSGIFTDWNPKVSCKYAS